MLSNLVWQKWFVTAWVYIKAAAIKQLNNHDDSFLVNGLAFNFEMAGPTENNILELYFCRLWRCVVRN